MSASPMARQVASTQAIPIRRVLLNDPSELPSHYSQTPGGTLFSTTPGGTKIVYERNFLLNLRNSPVSRTPPKCEIPENLVKGSGSPPKKYQSASIKRNKYPQRTRNDSFTAKNSSIDDDQFQMDL
ncbi:eukaryotic translation initiation factor 4E-binding protein 2 [Sitophilus oryzae]|uniref:Eukaryotic translation initiation factor 4E-binding protein 2 n=1 Tax=Sitophilus oryzae TaxID=7048 RepID=A0A6J2XTX9_SITOR|nr:eukaryotic translation initiation factor 4E-binding protein 2 [Sitophilus oryzae]